PAACGGRVGGRLVERSRSGEEAVWGELLVWEPPHRFAMTWYPGRGPSEATELEVRFEPDGDRTRVELQHRGWDGLGERAADARASYDSGWVVVLGEFPGAGPVNG